MRKQTFQEIMEYKPKSDGEETIQMKMTTELPPQIGRSPKLSADFLKEYYSKQAATRSVQLKSINLKTNFATLYNTLVPEVYCPDLVRVGNVNDGGKWVCNPVAMPKENCTMYSLGLRNDISFDQEMQEFNGNKCKVYGYDAVQQSPNTVERYKAINGVAEKKTIATTTNETTGQAKLGDLFRAHGDNYTEILKMDIEGAEYETLPAFLDEFRVCQLFLEMHGQAYKMRDLLQQISKRNYLLFFYEVNGDSLSACEYSFIHPDCMERYGVFMLSPYINASAPIG